MEENDMSQLLVVIRSICYNQAPYVRQTLDGFVMQKTTFPFIAIVHDDASTDGTAEIIKEYAEKYPNIIKPIYETENQYSKNDGSLERIMNAAIPESAKYIAFCEGDDYWIDPLKLQKQVDFLEENSEYGLCYSSVYVYNQKRRKLSKKSIGGLNDSLESLIYDGNKIPTLTVLCRAELFFKYNEDIEPFNKKWLMGDYPLWIYISKNAKIKYMAEPSGVYRMLSESASHSKDPLKNLAFRKSVREIQNYFIEKYDLKPLPQLDEDALLMGYYIQAAKRKQAYAILKKKKPHNMRQKIKLMFFSSDFLFGIYITTHRLQSFFSENWK